MKTLLILLALSASASTLATVTLDVTEKGFPAGTEVWSVKLGPNELVERHVVQPGGKQASKTVVRVLSADGSVSKIDFDTITTILSNGRITRGRTSVSATFPVDKEAEAVIRLGGRTIKQPIPNPPLPLLNSSAFWFIRDQPKPDTTVEFADFDVLNLRWVQVDRTFVGRRAVPGSQFVGEANLVHEVRDGVDWNLYLDDKGEPILVESGTTRMLRR